MGTASMLNSFVNALKKAIQDIMPALIDDNATFELQPQAEYSDVAVQNEWNEVLAVTANVRILMIYVTMVAADEDIAIKVTIDGRTLEMTAETLTFGIDYVAVLTGVAEPSMFTFKDSTALPVPPLMLEGRSVKVEVRKTTANGANTLTCRVLYAKR